MTTETVSDEPEKRARIPETHASVNPETFAVMLESDGNLETYTELKLDLHEPDPERMSSSDLGWVPKSILQEAARKRSRNCSNLERPKRSHKLRLRDRKSGVCFARVYESSHADPASLFAATPSS